MQNTQSRRPCSDQCLLVSGVLQWYQVDYHQTPSSPGAQLIEDAQLAYYNPMEPMQKSHPLLELPRDQPMLEMQQGTAHTSAIPSVLVFAVASSLKQVLRMGHELSAMADHDVLQHTIAISKIESALIAHIQVLKKNEMKERTSS